MQKRKLSLLVMVIALVLSLSLGCSGSLTDSTNSSSTTDSSSVITQPTGKITLNYTSAKVDVYDTLQLVATATDIEGEIEWSGPKEKT